MLSVALAHSNLTKILRSGCGCCSRFEDEKTGPQKGSRLPEGADPAEIRPLLQLQPFSVLRPKLDSGCPGPLALLTAGVRRRLESRGSGRGSSFLLVPVLPVELQQRLLANSSGRFRASLHAPPRTTSSQRSEHQPLQAVGSDKSLLLAPPSQRGSCVLRFLSLVTCVLFCSSALSSSCVTNSPY